jgi:hypothetical protein
MGPEQRLRRQGPQGSGGCVKNPMRFIVRSLGPFISRRVRQQRIISQPSIRKSHINCGNSLVLNPECPIYSLVFLMKFEHAAPLATVERAESL